MKRSLLVVLSVVVLLTILVVGATWVLGALTEDGFRSYISDVETNPAMQQVDLTLPDYDRGFLKSSGTTSIAIVGVEQETFLRHEIYHGPLAFTPDGLKPGFAYIVTTLDRQKFPDELQESLREVYGENEPFIVTTTVPLTGNRVTEIEVAPVDHSEGTLAVKFEGAESRFEVAPDNKSATGEIHIGALTMKETTEGEGFDLTLEKSNINISGEENASLLADGTIGKMTFESESGAIVEVDAIEMNADYSAMSEGSPILLGTAKILTPSVTVTLAEAGEVTVADLSFQSETGENDGLVESTVTYEVASVEETISDSDEMSPYFELMKDGARLGGTFQIPETAMETLTEVQQKMQATQRALLSNSDRGEEFAAEQTRLVAEAYLEMLQALTKGSGFSLGFATGAEESGMNLDLALTYVGAEPLTSQKTILELVQNILVEIGARVPKSLLPDTPEMQQQMAMLTATSSIIETATDYRTEMILEGGKLTTNGQPNLLFEQMASMMTIEIPWDAILEGMQSAAAADPAEKEK